METAAGIRNRDVSVRSRPSSLLARAAGHGCVALLTLIRGLPAGVTAALLYPLLPIYPLLRPAHAARLRACFAAAPCAHGLTLGGYYQTRLRLILLGLKSHGRGNPPATDPGATTMEGLEIYRAALAADRPVALIGCHAGLLEDLHRVPPKPDGRPFRILTAPAFSPPLTAFMARGREQDGKEILWIGNGTRGLEAGLRHLISAKGVLALMADQHPGRPEDCGWLSLWGKVQAPYPARLLRFLAEREFLFVPVSARLEAYGSASFRFHAAWDFRDGPTGPDVGLEARIGRRVRGFLETVIADAPDQWNWSYPKIRPQ